MAGIYSLPDASNIHLKSKDGTPILTIQFYNYGKFCAYLLNRTSLFQYLLLKPVQAVRVNPPVQFFKPLKMKYIPMNEKLNRLNEWVEHVLRSIKGMIFYNFNLRIIVKKHTNDY
ncbi:hypothetical protein D3C87_1513340 [compost metagenome]